MSTLPVAFRPKEGAELIWTSGQEIPVAPCSGLEELAVGVVSVYAPSCNTKRSMQKRGLKLVNLDAQLRTLALNYSPAHLHFKDVVNDYVLIHVESPGLHKEIGHDFFTGAIGGLAFPFVSYPVIEVPKPTSEISPQEPGQFILSEGFVRAVIAAQAEGQPSVGLAPDSIRELRQEVSERVEEAIAEIGYRWVRRKKQVSRIFTFDSADKLQWCDHELAKLLVFELNIAIISAQKLFETLVGELVEHLRRSTLRGDWGSLQVDGPSVLLVPASEG